MTLDITDGELWQWDTGREVEAAGCEQVHFAKSTAGTCYTVEVADNKAKIPDELLQAAGRVYAWAYITDETYGGRTRIEALWDVKRRARPAEYVYEPSDQRTIKDAETGRDEAKAAQKAAEAARDRAIAAEVKGARATTLASGSEATAAMEGNVLVVGVPKGDALRYSDLTDEQVAELKKPATDAAAEIGKTNEEYKAMLTEQAKAFGDAQRARAESYTDAERARDRAYTKAETDRNAAYDEAEGGRKTAETERDTAEKERVEAEGEREQGWTDLKAEAEKSVGDAVERADAASKAATKAIADVKATEAKLYPVAENVLKGTANGTFIHVDDAFPSSLLGIEIEGACKQDGTPSPDNPVPIQVVENPVFKVTGRNLLDNKYPTYTAAYNNGVAIIKKYSYDNPSTVLPFTTGPRSSNGFGFIEKLKPNVTYTLKAFNSPDKSVVCIAGYKRVEDIGNPSNAVWHLKETGLGGPVSFSVKEGGECVVFTFAAEWGDETNKITYPADFKATIEHGSTATDYKPYTSQSQVFTLPAEHPYLAKVDNKADEIRVDRDGNVELVARVGVDKNVRKVGAFQRGEYYSFNTNLSPFASQNEDYGGIMLCSTLQSRYLTSNSDGIYRTWNGVYVKDTSGRTKEEIQAEVDKNAPLTVVAKIPEKRYPLGKIEIPKAQDSIVNAWTDAEVTPRTGIEYTRDVNIVVANLESAIASITEG